MSAYTEHSARCDTCDVHDHPGSRKYSVTSRCTAGQQLYETTVPETGTFTTTTDKKVLTREPEVFVPLDDPQEDNRDATRDYDQDRE